MKRLILTALLAAAAGCQYEVKSSTARPKEAGEPAAPRAAEPMKPPARPADPDFRVDGLEVVKAGGEQAPAPREVAPCATAGRLYITPAGQAEYYRLQEEIRRRERARATAYRFDPYQYSPPSFDPYLGRPRPFDPYTYPRAVPYTQWPQPSPLYRPFCSVGRRSALRY